jgi:hypothetical protein
MALCFHIFGSVHAMKTTIRFRNKRFNQFLTIVIVIINIVAIYGPLKSNMIILYQITQLSEQKYRLAITFAENNFGPFEHIVFVIVLFESPSKTLFRVLFPRLYLQICIFYKYISISCPTVSPKWVNPNRKYDEKRQNNATFVSYDPAKARNGFGRAIFKTRNGESGNGNGEWEWERKWERERHHKKTSFKKTNKFFVCLHGEKNIIYTL